MTTFLRKKLASSALNGLSKTVRKVLPRINPLLPCLGDAYHFLNEALDLPATETRGRARLSRASSMHALSALHAGANTALWSSEIAMPVEATLASKFERLLHDFQQNEVLKDVELVVLHELEILGGILHDPHVAQARDYPHPERKDLIEFERTPLKGFSHDITTWPPAYAGVVLGMVNGFLGRFFRERCECDAARVEALLGHHASSDTYYSAAFDPQVLRDLKAQEQRLLLNASFLLHMSSERWKIPSTDFQILLLDGCWA